MKCIVFHADVIDSRNNKLELDDINALLYNEICIKHNASSIPKIILGDTFQFILELKYINEVFSIIRSINKIFNNNVRISVTVGILKNEIQNKLPVYSHELPNEELFYKSSENFKEIYKIKGNYNNELKSNVILSLSNNDVLNKHINSVYLAIENITRKWKSIHYSICLLVSREVKYQYIIESLSSENYIKPIKYESQLSRTIKNNNIRLVLRLEDSCIKLLKEK